MFWIGTIRSGDSALHHVALREAFEDIGPLAGLYLSDVNLIHFQTHHRARGVGHADDRLIEGFEGVPGQGQGGTGAFRPRGRARWIPG